MAGLRRRDDGLGGRVPARRPPWGYVWTAPNTLFGLLAAASVMHGRVSWWRGVLLVEEARGGIAAVLSWRKFAAITFGHVVISRLRASDRLLAHELTHVAQYERWGPAYFPAYLLASVTGYRRNPFERAAREAARAATAEQH